MTVFLPAPQRLRSGFVVLEPELEEEYLARPANVSNTPIITGPGIAEIKPHTEKQIRQAHRQLATELATSRGRKYKAALIVTYRPVGRTTGDGTPVEVYATAYRPNAQRPTSAPLPEYLRGPWWDLSTVHVPRTIGVNLADRSVFGAAAERAVRTRFGQFLEQPPHRRSRAVTTPPYKSPNEPGSDIEWTEIAEMYAELARSTNDEFLAELANELATPG